MPASYYVLLSSLGMDHLKLVEYVQRQTEYQYFVASHTLKPGVETFSGNFAKRIRLHGELCM